MSHHWFRRTLSPFFLLGLVLLLISPQSASRPNAILVFPHPDHNGNVNLPDEGRFILPFSCTTLWRQICVSQLSLDAGSHRVMIEVINVPELFFIEATISMSRDQRDNCNPETSSPIA